MRVGERKCEKERGRKRGGGGELGMLVCLHKYVKHRGGNLLVMRTKLFLPSSLEGEKYLYIYVYMYQTAKI